MPGLLTRRLCVVVRARARTWGRPPHVRTLKLRARPPRPSRTPLRPGRRPAVRDSGPTRPAGPQRGGTKLRPVALKNIPGPGFPADTGSADPALADALAAWQRDPGQPGAEERVLEALAGARLLVPVVAVAGETETDAAGLRRDKTSEMAVPTLTAPGGRRALPVFTCTESLARWDGEARPVAVPLHQALRALAQEQADTLVVDLAGPVTYQLTGPALRALAGRRPGAAPGVEVTEALRSLLAAEPDVEGAHLAPGGPGGDATLALTLSEEAAADPGRSQATVRRLADALAGDETLRSRLVRGLELALLPPGSALPEGALYRR